MNSILVVEDDRATRHLLTGLLKAANFSVTAAQDGANALRHLKRQSVDLMLLDIWMPRMNGLEVLARLRSEPARPKVVVMTSDDTPETLLQAVREQAYQYVTKPVEPKALVELLRHVLATAPVSPPIEVISAKPSWVELLVPCERLSRTAAQRDRVGRPAGPEPQGADRLPAYEPHVAVSHR